MRKTAEWPWTINKADNDIWALHDKEGKHFANFRAVNENPGELDPFLVAAAPDLLEALLLALPYVESAEDDPVYKPGAVKKVVETMLKAIARVEP